VKGRDLSRLRVAPGSKVVLADFDPDFVPRWAAEVQLESSVARLAEYQERLAAQATHGLLVVLQGIDASGKDGTVRHVFSGVNPQGVVVHSFKVPSEEELEHDYLWRYALRLPQRGLIAVFNRSHYEEVLVVRVHAELLAREKVAKDAHIWKRRYREINDWERYLTDNGIHVVKLFLNLSKDEQRKRFLARIDEPEKNWKFNADDVEERRFWDDYQHAFSELLSHTSTEWAPWHVVPADDKKVARVVVAEILVDTLAAIDPKYPTLDDEAQRELERARAGLEAEG
jgi:PPK2 family polyphosphate:nucleotide phosphotransferase